MTPEARLERLERVAKLIIKAGLRARGQMRDQDGKINILVDLQIKNEERFGKLAEAQLKLAESQTHTDQRLDVLIDILREGHNGRSSR